MTGTENQIINLTLNDRPPHERLAGESNVSPATIARDAKFADAVDSIAAPVGEYARSILFDSRLIGAALFNRRGAGEIVGRRAVGRFGTRPHSPMLGYFGTCLTPEPAKRPTFNAVNSAPELHFFGAVTWGVTHFRP
jgi:hypothetical protein